MTLMFHNVYIKKTHKTQKKSNDYRNQTCVLASFFQQNITNHSNFSLIFLSLFIRMPIFTKICESRIFQHHQKHFRCNWSRLKLFTLSPFHSISSFIFFLLNNRKKFTVIFFLRYFLFFFISCRVELNFLNWMGLNKYCQSSSSNNSSEKKNWNDFNFYKWDRFFSLFFHSLPFNSFIFILSTLSDCCAWRTQ